MLASKQLRSAKVVGQTRHASIGFQRVAPNTRFVGGLQLNSNPSRVQLAGIQSLHCRSTSPNRSRVSTANAETATAVTTVETGLLELNKDSFHDFINSAGDAVVVVDFFTDW